MPNKQMKLVLREAVPHLGRRGDVVTVASGYGRNYLLPEGLAFLWTEGAQKAVEAMQQRRRAEELATREEAIATKALLEGLVLEIAAKASESGKLFGGISADRLAKELGTRNIVVKPKDLHFDPIRRVGTFEVTAKLHPEIETAFTVSVSEDK